MWIREDLVLQSLDCALQVRDLTALLRNHCLGVRQFLLGTEQTFLSRMQSNEDWLNFFLQLSCLSLSDESEEFSIGASSSDELEDEPESEEESDDEFGLPSSRASGTSLASGCWSPMGNFMFLTTIGLARRDSNRICARGFQSPSAPPLRSSMRCTLFIALLSFFL